MVREQHGKGRCVATGLQKFHVSEEADGTRLVIRHGSSSNGSQHERMVTLSPPGWDGRGWELCGKAKIREAIYKALEVLALVLNNTTTQKPPEALFGPRSLTWAPQCCDLVLQPSTSTRKPKLPNPDTRSPKP